jgi:hypothetical protein
MPFVSDMVKLAIVGKADKRILAYPLMHVCSFAGQTCVVTDDAAFKRLYAGEKNTGTCGDVKIRFVAGLSDESEDKQALLSAIEAEEQDASTDLLLYITESYLPPDTEKMIAICSANKTFLGYEMDEMEDTFPYAVLADLTIFPKSKGFWGQPVKQILLKPEYMQYLAQVEEQRMLAPLKDKTVNVFLAKTFAQSLSVKEVQYLKIAARKQV